MRSLLFALAVLVCGLAHPTLARANAPATCQEVFQVVNLARLHAMNLDQPDRFASVALNNAVNLVFFETPSMDGKIKNLAAATVDSNAQGHAVLLSRTNVLAREITGFGWTRGLDPLSGEPSYFAVARVKGVDDLDTIQIYRNVDNLALHREMQTPSNFSHFAPSPYGHTIQYIDTAGNVRAIAW